MRARKELAHARSYAKSVNSKQQSMIQRRTKRQHTQRISHSIILVRDQEEDPIARPAPDKHIRHDARNKPIVRDRQGAAPIQRSKVPRQRARHDADVHEARRRRVPEVQEAQVEEIHEQQQFGEHVVAAHEEVHEAEEE